MFDILNELNELFKSTWEVTDHGDRYTYRMRYSTWGIEYSVSRVELESRPAAAIVADIERFVLFRYGSDHLLRKGK